MSFAIILETTSLPNVLVKMICDYNNFRPVAYQFCQAYLKKRLSNDIVKLLNFDVVVDVMIKSFETRVEYIAKRGNDLCSVEIPLIIGEMFPMIDDLRYLFNGDFEYYQEENLKAQNYLMYNLYKFVKGEKCFGPETASFISTYRE